ncbi:hypothetical protein QYM36_004758 [Artemia franciscana]|uniref:Uncharacterized protein n=1 Tax=Artemia franciscana TaxID=6661 RepID=A0AA88IHR4_ARTSF|nr:hypothetical protein QYM36_004758 [Artemia franciscana]
MNTRRKRCSSGTENNQDPGNKAVNPRKRQIRDLSYEYPSPSGPVTGESVSVLSRDGLGANAKTLPPDVIQHIAKFVDVKNGGIDAYVGFYQIKNQYTLDGQPLNWKNYYKSANNEYEEYAITLAANSPSSTLAIHSFKPRIAMHLSQVSKPS